MSVTLDRSAIEKLSVEDRFKLMELIWETLVEQHADIPLSDASYEELMRRLDYARANPDAWMSLEEFKAKVHSRRASAHSSRMRSFCIRSRSEIAPKPSLHGAANSGAQP